MRKAWCGALLSVAVLSGSVQATVQAGTLVANVQIQNGRYDVTWDSPSVDSSGSMPLGNGDIGLNAWFEPSGELAFYISKTDAWGDNSRLLKVGKVRISFDPPLPTGTFRQTLRLQQGTLEAVCGEGNDASTIRVWVDANHPVIEVSADGSRERSATAAIELWRTTRFELPSIECSDVKQRPTRCGREAGADGRRTGHGAFPFEQSDWLVSP